MILAERYRLNETLGQGGSAVVHAAFDERLRRRVALKWAREPADTSVRDQALICADLIHPRLVRVLDLGEAEGRSFAVMDLIAGRSVRELLSACGRPDPVAVLEAIAGVLDGLGEAHRQGITHGDLSAGNVLIPDSATGPNWAAAMLTDLAAPPPTDGQLRVSPHYTAPEVASGRVGDQRSDLYSVGALTWQLLTGVPLFDHDDPAAVLTAHVRTPAPMPSRYCPSLPPALDALVLTALAKQPEERFADAATMAEQVERVRGIVATAAPVREGRTTTALAPRPQVRAVGTLPLGRVTVPEGAVVWRPVRSWAAWVGWSAAAMVGVGLLWWLARGESSPPVPVAITSTSAAAAASQPTTAAPPTGSAPAIPVPAVPELVAVPQLLGMDATAAQSVLTAAGLHPGAVTVQDSASVAGTVLLCAPAAGTPVNADSTVDLVIASGWTAVPHSDGASVGEVLQALTAAGLRAGTTRFIEDRPDLVPGIVVHMVPSGGMRAELGTPIDLFVTRLAVSSSPTASATGDPAQDEPTAPEP